MKMKRTECSESLAFKLQTLVNHPEETIQQEICLFVSTTQKAAWQKTEFGISWNWDYMNYEDVCCFQMYQKILLWTTSLIHHAAVHLKETFRRMLKGTPFHFVLELTLMVNMVQLS
jgi:hypothetical protein